MGRWLLLACCVCALVLPRARHAWADDIDDQLAVLSRVGPDGAGSAEARLARDALIKQGSQLLPRLLLAMDDANSVACNWHRSVYDQIVRQELTNKQPRFDRDALKDYVRGPQHLGRARRLVLTLLDQLEPEFGRDLVPQLLDDPEFRADAVDRAWAAGEEARQAGSLDRARQQYRLAFEHARDAAQVTRAADQLRALGETADIIAHLGFVVDWYLVGPFDAPGYSGFDAVFVPQQETFDLQAQFRGAGDRKLTWQRHTTSDALGQLNLISALGEAREAVAYAYSELVADAPLEAQLRCGADDNCTVWLNDQLVFSRRQWLNGTRLDRFTAPVTLQAGTNRLLVKVCQGPQHKDPDVGNLWSLQLRFCDAQGAGLGLKNGLPDPTETNAKKGQP